ncbi:MAG: hypothetical protein LBS04_04820 [Tannerellaceae bacterium]|jgi:hypothetical protein|nr:hypothetical protein [Tannerellaceae bacterium]
MNKIIKSVILLSGILLFLISCKEDLAEGGQSYPLGLETHHLLLKNDAAASEVRIKNTDWRIAGIGMDSVLHQNSSAMVSENGNYYRTYRDTMVMEWIELSRIDDGRKLKVKLQPNTTGKERSFEVVFFAPYRHDTALKITQQP